MPDGPRIAILGLGPSLDTYTQIVRHHGGRRALCDEVWAVNSLGDMFACDRVFHMDDVRVQERRAPLNPRIAQMLDWMRDHPGPIMTSHADDRYPGLVAYPLDAVVRDLKFCWFNSTVAYAVAYAIHIGASEIYLFGIDFTYPDRHAVEAGRGCVEFWLGVAHQRGITIGLPDDTSLTDRVEGRPLYGYDGYAVTRAKDGGVVLTPGTLPTGAEIEARYDHHAHARRHDRGCETCAQA